MNNLHLQHKQLSHQNPPCFTMKGWAERAEIAYQMHNLPNETPMKQAVYCAYFRTPSDSHSTISPPQHISLPLLATNTCIVCDNGHYMHHDQEGCLLCNICGHQTTFYMDAKGNHGSGYGSNLSFYEQASFQWFQDQAAATGTHSTSSSLGQMKNVMYQFSAHTNLPPHLHTHERLVHFKELMHLFRPLESNDQILAMTNQIPEAVIDTVRKRVIKERIAMADLSYQRIRILLRYLNLSKYQTQIPLIQRLLGVPLPHMDDSLYQLLCHLYLTVELVWALFCPDDRSHFMRYTYLFHQLCRLVDQTKFLPYVAHIQDPSKLQTLDVIYKKICNHLKFVYTPFQVPLE